MQHMAVDPNAPAGMMYGPMLIGISYDGGKMNSSSSACPFAVTVLNTAFISFLFVCGLSDIQ